MLGGVLAGYLPHTCFSGTPFLSHSKAYWQPVYKEHDQTAIYLYIPWSTRASTYMYVYRVARLDGWLCRRRLKRWPCLPEYIPVGRFRVCSLSEDCFLTLAFVLPSVWQHYRTNKLYIVIKVYINKMQQSNMLLQGFIQRSPDPTHITKNDVATLYILKTL